MDIYDYEISGKYEDIQTTTDRGNSAVYFTQDGQKIIADHVDQGFYKIKNVVPGHTVATVNGEEYIYVHLNSMALMMGIHYLH